MTRLTLPRNRGSHQPERAPDLPPLPVDPDKGPTPDLLPDDPQPAAPSAKTSRTAEKRVWRRTRFIPPP